MGRGYDQHPHNACVAHARCGELVRLQLHYRLQSPHFWSSTCRRSTEGMIILAPANVGIFFHRMIVDLWAASGIQKRWRWQQSLLEGLRASDCLTFTPSSFKFLFSPSPLPVPELPPVATSCHLKLLRQIHPRHLRKPQRSPPQKCVMQPILIVYLC